MKCFPSELLIARATTASEDGGLHIFRHATDEESAESYIHYRYIETHNECKKDHRVDVNETEVGNKELALSPHFSLSLLRFIDFLWLLKEGRLHFTLKYF